MADSLIRPIAVNVNTGALTYSGSLTTSEITDGTLTTADIDTTSFDARYALVSEVFSSVTATKTGDYVATAGQMVPVDATSGNVAVTLPTSASAGQTVGVRRMDASTNTLTVQRGGSDTIASGTSTVTSTTITLQDSTQVYVSNGSGAWVVAGGHKSLTQLDTRFGRILATQYYCPNADQNYSTTSSSDADVDATNAAVTFTVPTSGAVWVTASFYATVASTCSMDVTLRESSSTLTLTKTRAMFGGSSSIQGRVSIEWKFTGLTPGSAHTYKLGFARQAGASTCEIHAGTTGGPLSLVVTERP